MPAGPEDGTSAHLPARPPVPAVPALRVYVTAACAGCVRARKLVGLLRRRRPGAVVELVDVDRLPPGQSLPPGLVGTPTYVLGGQVRWLGNPDVEDLLAGWDEHAGQDRRVRQVDVLVVGAGQAGLGTAYWLRRLGCRDVLVVDRGPVGQSWLDRWDSLRLFTPRRFSRLPGRPFPQGRGRCPRREEMAAYLRDYAAHLGVPVETGVQVRRLRRSATGFTADTSAGTLQAGQVVVATGPFSRPHVPSAGTGLDPTVTQLHSADYRRPGDLPPGPVLVVGGGNSAAQLAVELAATHRVTVAAPREPEFLPEVVLGLSVYWPLWLAGVLHAPSTSRVSRRVQERGDVVVGTPLRRLVRAGRVALVTGRVVAARGRQVTLADGRELDVSTVLWCTGYRPDTSWLDVPGALDPGGAPVHAAGASPVPGLHWMGLPWQTRLSSSIISGVDSDARRTARRVLAA